MITSPAEMRMLSKRFFGNKVIDIIVLDELKENINNKDKFNKTIQ